jgi:hypothetical protein
MLLIIEGTIRPVLMRYTMPYTIGRGYASLVPRHKLVERFRASGKARLILLLLSDFGPDGDEIAHHNRMVVFNPHETMWFLAPDQVSAIEAK